MYGLVLDLLFPRVCSDDVSGIWLSSKERDDICRLQALREDAAFLRSIECKFLDVLVAGGSYRGCKGVRRAIHLFKYKRISSLAPVFADALCGAAELLPSYEYVLCPIPLHWSRQFDRGFNQSETLAALVSRQSGWPMETLLKRTRSTGKQSLRGRAARQAAMEDVFVMNSAHVPESVLLVDDIATTLSTIDACARVLKRHGVRHVAAIVVARG